MSKLVLNIDVGKNFSYLDAEKTRGVLLGIIYGITCVYSDFGLADFNFRDENDIAEIIIDATTGGDLLSFKNIFIGILNNFLEDNYVRKRHSCRNDHLVNQDFVYVAFSLNEKTNCYTFVRKSVQDEDLLVEKCL